MIGWTINKASFKIFDTQILTLQRVAKKSRKRTTQHTTATRKCLTERLEHTIHSKSLETVSVVVGRPSTSKAPKELINHPPCIGLCHI